MNFTAQGSLAQCIQVVESPQLVKIEEMTYYEEWLAQVVFKYVFSNIEYRFS